MSFVACFSPSSCYIIDVYATSLFIINFFLETISCLTWKCAFIPGTIDYLTKNGHSKTNCCNIFWLFWSYEVCFYDTVTCNIILAWRASMAKWFNKVFLLLYITCMSSLRFWFRIPHVTSAFDSILNWLGLLVFLPKVVFLSGFLHIKKSSPLNNQLCWRWS